MNEVTLGSIGKFIRGRGIPTNQIIDAGGVPCIRYADIYTSYNEVTEAFTSLVSLENAKKAQPVQKGDIIFPTAGETMEEIGKALAYIGSGVAFAGEATLILRDHGQNPAYLAYALNERRAVKQLARLAAGQQIVNLYVSELRQVSIMLPSLAEQGRIVEILSDADMSIALTKRLAANEKEFFYFFIAKKFDHSLNETKPIGALVDFEKGKPVHLVDKGGKQPCIGAASFDGRYSRFTNDSSGTTCIETDVLLLWDGENAGKATTCHMGVVGSTVARLRPKNGNNNLFISGFLSRSFEKIQLMREGSSIPHLPKDFLERFRIPAISKKEQIEIASLMIRQRTLQRIISDQIATLKKQKQGLMQKLLTDRRWVLPKKRDGK